MGPLDRLFPRVRSRPEEVSRALPGDGVVPAADVVMDRGFSVGAGVAEVWPWLVQLGKGRAGWYLPTGVERVVPGSRRAARSILSEWQGLAVGDVVPDWGGPHETFEVVALAPQHHLVYRSTRGRTRVSWAIVLAPEGRGTRVHLRLRLAPVRRVRLARSLGGLLDALTVAGMAAGLRERVERGPRAGR